MHFKNGRSSKKSGYAWKGTTSWVMVASRPKVSFWLDNSSTCPGYYGWLFVYHAY
jgi:hypothetical protein